MPSETSAGSRQGLHHLLSCGQGQSQLTVCVRALASRDGDDDDECRLLLAAGHLSCLIATSRTVHVFARHVMIDQLIDLIVSSCTQSSARDGMQGGQPPQPRDPSIAHRTAVGGLPGGRNATTTTTVP